MANNPKPSVTLPLAGIPASLAPDAARRTRSMLPQVGVVLGVLLAIDGVACIVGRVQPGAEESPAWFVVALTVLLFLVALVAIVLSVRALWSERKRADRDLDKLEQLSDTLLDTFDGRVRANDVVELVAAVKQVNRRKTPETASTEPTAISGTSVKGAPFSVIVAGDTVEISMPVGDAGFVRETL